MAGRNGARVPQSPNGDCAKPELEDVVLVAATESIPQFTAYWPVRVDSAANCSTQESYVYLCGLAADVKPLLGTFEGRLLGLLVEDGRELQTSLHVEVLPELAQGFTSSVWEAAVAAICSRHLETIPRMIHRHARRRPDKPMLIYENRTWTYQQACSMAGSLVEHIEQCGYRPEGGPIAVEMLASDYLAITYLGLYAAGFTAHVVDSLPSSRAYKLSACKSQALLCMSDAEPEPSLPMIFVDKLELDAKRPLSAFPTRSKLEDDVFIEYTSGSTGRPKSVSQNHKRLAHWIRWREFHFPLPDGEDRVASNLFFIWYWHIAPCSGHTAVVYPTKLNYDATGLVQYLTEHRCNKMESLTPGLISAIMQLELQLPQSLKVLASGGEGLPMSVCTEWLRRYPGVTLWNNLATTETAADVCFCCMTPDTVQSASSQLYAPISDGMVCWNLSVEVADDEELVIKGWNVAQGYLPPTSSERFALSEDGCQNAYRTGDRAQWVDGRLFMLGRKDSTVKVRGYRVDLAGLESVMDKCSAVKDIAFVLFRESVWGAIVTDNLEEVKKFAEESLEHHKLIVWHVMEKLPLTLSAKRDRKKIQAILDEKYSEDVSAEELPGGAPKGDEEIRVAAAWSKVLGRPVGREETWTEAGGHSLTAMRLASQLGIAPAEVFAFPTVALMAARVAREKAGAEGGSQSIPAAASPAPAGISGERRVAIVGMSCRLPGADSAPALWEALQAGKDLLSDVPSAGNDRIPRKGMVPDEGFDCKYWGVRKEAAVQMETAQRVMLEVAHEALEDAGFDPFHVPGRVGVVVCGGTFSHYGSEVLGVDLDECRTERPDEYFALEIGTDKDYAATTLSYRLNLHGPSEVTQTACSSALVAVVRAVHLLRLGVCDYVVCGGVSFSPDGAVRKVDGMIWSPDGVCRPFADDANGTVNSDGCGLLVLTRMDAALQRGERIYATIAGAATNNDGSRKSSFSAPSHEGQVEVIRTALADAEKVGDDIDYIEAHGTGTRLGDPLEVLALAEALNTKREVLLGSVKGNLGHMNTAAAVPGLMKAVYMLHHQELVPTIHAAQRNSMIDWEKHSLRLAAPEVAGKRALKAIGLSSFGIGGTNAHVILEPAPESSNTTPPVRTPYKFQREPLTAPARKEKAKAAPAPSGNASREESLFYETGYERVKVSEVSLKDATVLLDGDRLPEGLPQGAVVATAARAVKAASASGALFYVGVSDLSPGADDTTQEELVMEIASLIDQLTKAKADIEVFFLIKKSVRYAGLWGLLRSAAREHPELRLRRLLWEEGASIVLPVMPCELVLRADGAYAPRLRPVAPPAPPGPARCYRRAMVTGGLRGLGVRVAQWLVSSGRAASLVVVGRNAPCGEQAEALRELGAKYPVEVCLCDVSEWAAVEKLPDCDLVVHAAGNVKDGLLVHASREDVQKVLRPKVRGSLHLRRRFPEARLLGFSSSSGLAGSAAQATYAFANTFVDSVMATVQWGGWGEVGMAKDLNISPLPGERFFPVAVGLESLGRVLDSPERKDNPMCVLDCDWASFRLNSTQFYPEDPLLADVQAIKVPSLLGTPGSLGDRVHGWTMVVGSAGARWHGTHPAWEVCQQHVVGGSPLFPATAFVSLALEALAKVGISAQLTDISFLRPLELAGPRHLTTTLVQGADDHSGSVRFTSRPLQDGPETLHCTCSFSSSGSQRTAEPLALDEALRPVEVLYDLFGAAGFHYGPDFRTSGAAVGHTMASCRLPEHRSSPFAAHPAVLDAAGHLASLLHPLGCRGVPQSIRRLTLSASSAAPVDARARFHDGQVDIQLLDAAGSVTCFIEGLELAVLDAAPTLQLHQRVPQEVPPEARGLWLARGAEAAALALPKVTSSPSEGHVAEVVAVRAQTLEDVRRCREEVRQAVARAPTWLVALEDAPFAEVAAAAAIEVGAQAVVGTAEEVRAVAEGLGVAYPIVRARNGKILADQMQEPSLPSAAVMVAGDETAFAVSVDPSRGPQGAKAYLSERRPPAAGEVEVRTSLWALNFRDVLVAVGAIPSEVAGQSLGIGGECYGEIVRVGPDVKHVAVGDKVVAVPPDGMGSHVTLNAEWVAQSPEGSSPEEAVSGTMVYATAWLGLHWAARVGKGDTVLIHSAAGGVGLSAVYLCLRAGCTVYTTASTEEKRNFLLSVGATGAFDSRNAAAFEKAMYEATGGEGVDVVLNSLSGDAIAASFRLLKPFGRFIEIGKRDQYEDTRIGLSPFLNGLTFSAAHIDVLMLRQPRRFRQLLEEVWEAMPSLPKLPTRTFDMAELPQALEYFSKGVHIGKVLVGISDEGTPALPARPAAVDGPAFDAVTQALRGEFGARGGPGGVVCVPGLADLASEAQLDGATVVVTASRAVAAMAATARPGALVVELPKWEPLKNLGDWLQLSGHFVMTEEQESEGDVREWLLSVVQEMAGSIEMDQTFEDAGLDSLELISLARRISTKVGRSVSVVDLYDNPTPEKLLGSFTGSPVKQLARGKVLVLHGFRSNKESMMLLLAPYVSALGVYEWVFLNSPRRASGPPAPRTLVEDSYEWWGQEGGSYETGWMAPHYDGLEDTLALAKSVDPIGVVGFSQGGGVASLLTCKWLALFSAVLPPRVEPRDTPSFHAWDPEEEYVAQCKDVSSYFTNKEVHTHSEGHIVPAALELVRTFSAFAARASA